MMSFCGRVSPSPFQTRSHTLSAHLLNYGARRFDSRVYNLIFLFELLQGQKKEQPTNHTHPSRPCTPAVPHRSCCVIRSLFRSSTPSPPTAAGSDRKIETRRWKNSKVVNNGTNHVERVKFRWDFPEYFGISRLWSDRLVEKFMRFTSPKDCLDLGLKWNR